MFICTASGFSLTAEQRTTDQGKNNKQSTISHSIPTSNTNASTITIIKHISNRVKSQTKIDASKFSGLTRNSDHNCDMPDIERILRPCIRAYGPGTLGDLQCLSGGLWVSRGRLIYPAADIADTIWAESTSPADRTSYSGCYSHVIGHYREWFRFNRVGSVPLLCSTTPTPVRGILWLAKNSTSEKFSTGQCGAWE